jgi:Spy/CpxP family protein refolding chaperone
MHPDLRIAPPGMWWKNPDIIQKLTLTSDQQKKMDDIFQQSRLQLIDLKANVEKQEVLLEPMLSANPPDTNKVLGQIDRVASARAELEKANARMLLGIRGVLSADQWTKLQAEQRENLHFLYRFKGPDGPNFRVPGGPGFSPKGPGPDSLRVFPDGPVTFQRLPHGPLSQLQSSAPPSFDLAVPAPEAVYGEALFELQPQLLDDDL